MFQTAHPADRIICQENLQPCIVKISRGSQDPKHLHLPCVVAQHPQRCYTLHSLKIATLKVYLVLLQLALQDYYSKRRTERKVKHTLGVFGMFVFGQIEPVRSPVGSHNNGKKLFHFI